MALSTDQQAMLQLLLERGQSYADLASLLGVGEAEVRARARTALTELAGADPDRHVGLTDYLLGQADPIGRADAVRHLKDDSADLDLAKEITQKIRLIAPDAELPRLPGEERRPRPRRARGPTLNRLPVPERLRRRAPETPSESGAGAETGAQRRLGTTLSKRQTQLAVGIGSAAVLLVAIVLALAGVFSSDSDGSGTPSTTDGTTTSAANTGPQGFPLTEVQVDSSGNVDRTFAIRKGLQGLLPRTQALYVTLAKKNVVASAIQTAVKSGQPIFSVKGDPAFTGIVNAANASNGVIPVPLDASAGVRGSGAAALGIAKSNQPFLQLKLTDVEQPPQDSAYIVWFVLASA
ncbi:MAG TPA: hypothetical protein VN458_02535 [Solirubrobacterales bacterium]|nr:hypothetical protein [Solirubrobacterales bacterium]